MVWTKGPSAQTLEIIRLKDQGARNIEIAQTLGLPYTTVANAVHKGRARGDIPPLPSERSMTARAHSMRNGMRFGSMVSMFEQLTEEQKVWLIDECIRLRIETYEEFVVELIRDAYEDSRIKKGDKQ